MVDFINLTGDVVAVVVTFSHGLVKLKVGLLDLSNRLGGSHKVPCQLLLDLGSGGIDESDVLKLLVVVSAAFFLFRINLPDNGSDLLRELIPQAIEVKLPP